MMFKSLYGTVAIDNKATYPNLVLGHWRCKNIQSFKICNNSEINSYNAKVLIYTVWTITDIWLTSGIDMTDNEEFAFTIS